MPSCRPAVALGLSMLAATQPALASGRPPVRVGYIEVATESGGSGVNIYAPVIEAVERMTGVAIPYSAAPPGRALPLLDAGHLDCVFPGDVGNRPVPYPVFQSRPLNRAHVHAFSRAGQPVRRSIESLKGLRIGTRHGYFYGTAFDPVRDRFVPAPSDDRAVALLLAGDTDVMLGYMPDMTEVFRNLPEGRLSWDPKAPLTTQAEAIMCRDTPATRALIATVDDALVRLEKSGELERLLGDRWVAPVR